ncbi:MAG TPA: hypothetical protein DDY91_23095 [Planctomycetaceae bacterium]|nr:hypothetical protein [Planctomycetaceae bacterium]
MLERVQVVSWRLFVFERLAAAGVFGPIGNGIFPVSASSSPEGLEESRMKTGRRVWKWLALGLVAFLGLGWWALRWEPAFYNEVRGLNRNDEKVRGLSKQFTQQVMQFADELRNESTFEAVFREDQVNAWLADEWERRYRNLLPPGLSRPRLHFAPEGVEAACQVEVGPTQVVANTAVRVFPTEDHRLGFAVDALRMGRVPLPATDLLEPLVSQLQRDRRVVEWRQLDGQDVLVLDPFDLADDDDRKKSPTERRLEVIELGPGELRVKGRQVRRNP